MCRTCEFEKSGDYTEHLSPAPRMSSDDVGDFYVDDEGSLWKLVDYCAEPTASLECVYPGGRGVSGAVGAPIFEGFTKLVRQNALDRAPGSS